jgi:hypothetical protein
VIAEFPLDWHTTYESIKTLSPPLEYTIAKPKYRTMQNCKAYLLFFSVTVESELLDMQASRIALAISGPSTRTCLR